MVSNTGKVSTPYPTGLTMKENGEKEKLRALVLPSIKMVHYMREIL